MLLFYDDFGCERVTAFPSVSARKSSPEVMAECYRIPASSAPRLAKLSRTQRLSRSAEYLVAQHCRLLEQRHIEFEEGAGRHPEKVVRVADEV